MDDQRTPPRGYRIPPPAPPPPPAAGQGRGGFLGWIGQHPRGAVAATVLALLIGLAVGLVVGNTQADEQRQRAERADARAADVERERDDQRARLGKAEGQIANLRGRVGKLSAKGDVPSFVGERAADVESDPAVTTYNWKIKTTDQISNRPPGTVLSQSPPEGTTLKAGGSITLVVAKKAPPKPKEWVTIQTLKGAGATKTDEFTLPRGLKARLLYDMPQDSNNIIDLYRPP